MTWAKNDARNRGTVKVGKTITSKKGRIKGEGKGGYTTVMTVRKRAPCQKFQKNRDGTAKRTPPAMERTKTV